MILVPVYWRRHLRDPLPSWFPGFRSTGSGTKDPFAIMISRPSWFAGSGAKETLCYHDFLGSGLLVPALKMPFAVMISVPVYRFRRSRFPLLSWFPGFRSTGFRAKWFRRLRDPLPSWFPGSGLLVPALKRPFAIVISWVPVYWFRCLRDPLPSWFPGFRSTGSGAKETLCHHDFLVVVYWFRR